MDFDFETCRLIEENIGRVIVGKKRAIDLLLTAVLAEGHVMIEDVPGLGKTLLAKSLARSIGGTYKRIQFTPDLLPADITGFNIYNQRTGEFCFQPGPVMANVLLADEINRTVPRTQASLLESMEEHQVTVDGQTYPLPRPFIVLATQNPIELEGTFALPEAQLDRFLMKIRLGYPTFDEEQAIMARFQQENPLDDLPAVAAPDRITAIRTACRLIHVSPPVRAYIAELVQATRTHEALRYGASPRASLALMRSAQARAALSGRPHVLPDDVKDVAEPVLAHRLILKDEERLRGERAERFLGEILDRTSPPVDAAR
ncbi:MAG: MoxR family ATPase [Proteobacteria bacterium]|nr:MoxR family ATPase [Pseudomonadota bacterium]